MTELEDLCIHIVDDDAAFRRSLVFLFESVGWQVSTHASAEDFLATAPATQTIACLVLDIRMPMMSGLELQQVLRSRGWAVPVVFITGHGDVELAVHAMKHGACDFLEKPFKDQALLDAVGRAVKLGGAARELASRCEEAQALLDRLSPREREVARLVAQGLRRRRRRLHHRPQGDHRHAAPAFASLPRLQLAAPRRRRCRDRDVQDARREQ